MEIIKNGDRLGH